MDGSATTDSAVLTPPSLTPAARRILDAASVLFYEHGLHAVGVDAIAAASGVTKRTLYDRFGSKDRLVTVYLQERHRAWWEVLEARLAAAPSPAALAVFDAYESHGLQAGRGCAFINAAGELPADHPAFAVIRAHKRSVRTRLAQVVREDVAGHAVDAETLTEQVFLLLEGSIAHQGIDPDGHHLSEARHIAAQVLAA